MLFLYNDFYKSHLINNMLKYYNINYNINNISNNHYLSKLSDFNINNIKNFYIHNINKIELIFILAIYPRNNNYINILNEIIKYCKTIIIIYSINPNYDIDIKYIKNFSSNNIILIEVDNIGYDFYKYNVGIKYILNNLNFDRIILLNDSFYFTRSIEDFISYIILSHNSYNLLGLNNSYQITLHIQSFILSFDKKICNEFLIYHKNNFNKNHNLQDIINIFEIGFSNYIINNNNYNTDTFYYIISNNNPYLEPEYSNLINLYNYPIKKTKII